jgi:hypothetical protein
VQPTRISNKIYQTKYDFFYLDSCILLSLVMKDTQCSCNYNDVDCSSTVELSFITTAIVTTIITVGLQSYTSNFISQVQK